MNRASIRVCILSLAKNRTRWPALEMRVRQLGFANVEVVEGVLGAALSRQELTRVLSPQALKDLDRPERTSHADLSGLPSVGIALAHAKIWQQQIRDKNAYMLVLEEDVLFDDTFSHRYDQVVGELTALAHQEKPCDLAYLGYWHHLGDRRNSSPNAKSCPSWLGVPDDQHILGAHAYIVRLEAANLLCRYLMPIEMQVDSYMGTLSRKCGIHRLLLAQPLVHQRLRLTTPTVHNKGLALLQSLQHPQLMDPFELASMALRQWQQEGWTF